MIDENNIEVNNNINEYLDNKVNKHLNSKIKGYNWHNKISDAFKNLKVDIKKKKINSKI